MLSLSKHAARQRAGARRRGAVGAKETVLLLAILCLIAAALAARLGGSDTWLWNLDLPKIHYPLAVFFSEAVRDGELPLWNDRLGLGFPLYAEGQIGAFYPPNWLIFRLEPLAALDLARVLHLAAAGLGTGLIALRLSGSRPGAVVAALTAILSGAIVTKLEWTNVVIAYAWAPWVLLPLFRTPAPSRLGLMVAGTLWGVQALAGHPNTWLLTGFSASALLLGTAPAPRTLLRIALFGCVGVAIGAVQLVPTLLLTTLSVRSGGLSHADIFTGAATPFDPLLFAFANAFVQNDPNGWSLPTAWYPDSPFALLESAAYVGIPILALAAIGWRVRRSRGLRVMAAALIAYPVLAAFEPEIWTEVPLLNGMRSPTRAYLFVDLTLALLAAIGVARLARDRAAPRWAWTVVAVGLVAYAGVTAAAAGLPATFEGVLRDFSWSVNLPPERAPAARAMALEALTRAWPVALEAAIALVFAVLVWARSRDRRRWSSWHIAGVAILPLLLLSPLANPRAPLDAFTFGGNDLHPALRSMSPHRVLTLGAPGWYPGMPDQLAAAGVPDVSMFSSLNLKASDELVETLRHDADAERLRRVLGIDVVVTFAAPCPGELRARTRSDDAYICSVTGPLRPPYWVPASAVREGSGSPPPWRAAEATLDTTEALRDAAGVAVERWTNNEVRLSVDAPVDGWVFLDRAWWPAWNTWIDGRSVTPQRALAGQLIRVPAGRHEIVQRLLPLEAIGPLVLGVALVAGGFAWALRPPAGRRRRSG
ncbi:MAG: hypothetical protein ACRDGE_05595 [Candidatus Limnocylindria bacterium]